MYLETWKLPWVVETPAVFLFFFPACVFFKCFFETLRMWVVFFWDNPPGKHDVFSESWCLVQMKCHFWGCMSVQQVGKTFESRFEFYFPWNLGTRKVSAAKGNLPSTYSGPISAYVVVRIFAQKLSWMLLVQNTSCVSTGRTWERKKVRLFVEVVVFFKHISLN